MACYYVDPATLLAEIAFVVADEWQSRGIGTALLRRLTEVARARGLSGFSANVLGANRRMLGIFHASGLRVHSELEGGIYRLVMYFDKTRQPPP